MKPRLGFVGVGWIGRNRMEAILAERAATVVAVADPSPERRAAALAIAPGAIGCEHLGQLLELPLDGVVIATPSALHADQAIACLGRGLPVFCQKPLARSADEARRVIAAARTADRLLGVDLSYRETAAVRAMREVVRTGELGRIFAVDLVFHNAYGPDAAWFYDKAASGGGCVMDLGIHLVDLALWLLEFPNVDRVTSRLFHAGVPITASSSQVEDFASVQLTAGPVVIRLACSWRVSAGRDAVIEASFYGTQGGIAMKNVEGSFYDFACDRFAGTRSERLVSPPDAWGGRAALRWIEQLTVSSSFDLSAERYADVSSVLDQIYAGGV